MIPEELKQKIYRLQEYLGKLAPYIELANNQLTANEEKRVAMERWFQLVADEAFDINASLAYQLGGKIADSHKSTFYELVPLKVIDAELADQLAESAKIRNQLTHEYERLSAEQVVVSIKKYFALYQTYLEILITKFITT